MRRGFGPYLRKKSKKKKLKTRKFVKYILPWRQLGQDQVAESPPSVELPGVKVGRRYKPDPTLKSKPVDYQEYITMGGN